MNQDNGSVDLLDYDPNVCRAMAKTTVRLVFGMWRYRTETVVTVGGNCSGLDVIRTALQYAFDACKARPAGDEEMPYITLTDAAGNTLECEDEEFKYEDWLADMLISAEIVALKPATERS